MGNAGGFGGLQLFAKALAPLWVVDEVFLCLSPWAQPFPSAKWLWMGDWNGGFLLKSSKSEVSLLSYWPY